MAAMHCRSLLCSRARSDAILNCLIRNQPSRAGTAICRTGKRLNAWLFFMLRARCWRTTS